MYVCVFASVFVDERQDARQSEAECKPGREREREAEGGELI